MSFIILSNIMSSFVNAKCIPFQRVMSYNKNSGGGGVSVGVMFRPSDPLFLLGYSGTPSGWVFKCAGGGGVSRGGVPPFRSPFSPRVLRNTFWLGIQMCGGGGGVSRGGVPPFRSLFLLGYSGTPSGWVFKCQSIKHTPVGCHFFVLSNSLWVIFVKFLY